MSAEKSRISYSVPVGGILLLFLGTVLFMQNSNWLPWGLWGTLWKFWPAIIIIFGLTILMRRVNMWLVSLLALVILFVCLGISVWIYMPGFPGGVRYIAESHNFPANGETGVQAGIDFSAGSITVNKLPTLSTNLAEANATQNDRSGSTQHVTMIPSFSRDGTVGILSLKPTNQQSWNSWGIGWDVSFSQRTPLKLNIKGSAAALNLDLRDLEVTQLDLKMDVCNSTLTLPVSVKDGVFNIEVNVGNLDIVAPDGVAVKIKMENTLGIAKIDGKRFPKQGDYYISPGYDTAINRVTLNVNSNIGKITVK
jgi:hypothetical protein